MRLFCYRTSQHTIWETAFNLRTASVGHIWLLKLCAMKTNNLYFSVCYWNYSCSIYVAHRVRPNVSCWLNRRNKQPQDHQSWRPVWSNAKFVCCFMSAGVTHLRACRVSVSVMAPYSLWFAGVTLLSSCVRMTEAVHLACVQGQTENGECRCAVSYSAVTMLINSLLWLPIDEADQVYRSLQDEQLLCAWV